MNKQEKAEQYARDKLGNWCHVVHSAYEISQCTNGEVSVQDYLAGYNEAKRWIHVGERLPCDLLDIYTYELTGRKETPLVLARIEDELVIAQMAKCKDDNHYKWVVGCKIIGRKITEWREI